MSHNLEFVEKNPWVGGFDGSCDCSDPDWTGDGWAGQVTFHGDTEREVKDQFLDHVLDVQR